MKTYLFLLLAGLSIILSSCKEELVDIDEYPDTLYCCTIVLHDSDGNNLLDPEVEGNLARADIRVLLKSGVSWENPDEYKVADCRPRPGEEPPSAYHTMHRPWGAYYATVPDFGRVIRCGEFAYKYSLLELKINGYSYHYNLSYLGEKEEADIIFEFDHTTAIDSDLDIIIYNRLDEDENPWEKM